MDTGASRPCKRLVICCDGTWNRPDSDHVTNIEKIARTVATDLGRTGGVQQLVLYLAGVGAGSYAADRLLGGAFGFGLFANIRSAYRFLALNYEPGDEIFVFGFSRGAYTARSLVGMVGRAGLLTRDALAPTSCPRRWPATSVAPPVTGRSARATRSSAATTAMPRSPSTCSACSTPSVRSASRARSGSGTSSTT